MKKKLPPRPKKLTGEQAHLARLLAATLAMYDCAEVALAHLDYIESHLYMHKDAKTPGYKFIRANAYIASRLVSYSKMWLPEDHVSDPIADLEARWQHAEFIRDLNRDKNFKKALKVVSTFRPSASREMLIDGTFRI